jgi:predicted RNase H-like HicB family nuclease
MRFQIAGREYDIDRTQIIAATEDVPPNVGDGRNKHYVSLHSRAYPIKQVLHLVTGRPYIEFTAQHAHRVLSALRFEVFQNGGDSLPPSAGTARGTDEEGEMFRFAVVLEPDEDGYLVVSCPSLPGCHSQGRTREEAIANIREAIRGYVASMREHGEPLPPSAEVHEVEVPV